MYSKSGVRGSDSGYCDIQNESRQSNSDYLIYPPSTMGVESKTRLDLGDGDRLRCSPRRLSTDLITPQMSVTSEHVFNVSSDSSHSRVTGSSCQALRHAVAALNRLDDFTSEKIGSGFFSEVFKVTHRTTGQVMVLKMNLHRSNRPNMLKEVQLMNQLSHPNILGFMGVCVHEGQLHALTEFINGGSLEQLILNSSLDLPDRTRMKLALDIAKGMEYLHSRGVFHRDLTSKNVLIKKDEKTSDMTAVVGDFGLAAKIPDPSDGYRLATVGSPYWMSPECLKGQWYDEKSDVFSYGIVLCELIARCEADPDILPRTENFGLDYLAFADMCGPCPPDFLELAFHCCNFEPKSRPSFSEIAKQLNTIIADYDADAHVQTLKKPEDAKTAAVSKLTSSLGAKSEEVLPQLNGSGPGEIKENTFHKKLSHRRSLSEEMGSIVFSPHTAPSDKARCHILVPRSHPSLSSSSRLTPKHVGESMCKQDPHYIPNSGDKANPFAALAQFRGVKKILGAPSKGLSPNSYVQGGGADLFSSCFELPSPFLGLITSDEELKRVDSVSDMSIGGQPIRSGENSSSWLESLSWRHPKLKRTVCKEEELKRFPKEGSEEKSVVTTDTEQSDSVKTSDQIDNASIFCSKNLFCEKGLKKVSELEKKMSSAVSNVSSTLPLETKTESLAAIEPETSSPFLTIEESEVTKKRSATLPVNIIIKPSNSRKISQPLSLPGSPTLIRRRLFSNSLVPASSLMAQNITSTLQPKIGTDSEDSCLSGRRVKSIPASSLFTHPLFKCNDSDGQINPLQHSLRSCSSTLNLADVNLLLTEDPIAGLGYGQTVLKRRGSCESGFFSSIGEDYGMTAADLLSPEFGIQHSRARIHNTSSATLSSSSAASSLFLCDDSAISTTTVSSLRSGSGEFADMDDPTPQGASTILRPHHSLLFAAKRSSSIYTDSSEDISSLGGGDLYWEEISRGNLGSQPQQISKIVEYFERKQNSANYPKPGVLDTDVWDIQDNIHGLPTSRHQREMLFHNYGNRNSSPMEFARRMEGASLNDAMRSSKIAHLRKTLERTGNTLQSPSPSSLEKPTGVVKRNVNATQRLMICEGAVKSKLPLFDKK